MPLPLLALGAGAIAGGALYNFAKGDPTSGVNSQMDEYYRRIKERQAPQLGAASQSQFSGFRDNQQALVSRLEAMSNGQGPSLAREQMKAATDANMASASSVAQSGRGNAALANIQAQNVVGRLGAQAAQDNSQLAMSEQLGAINQLGGVINQGRGNDEANTQFNALQQNYRDQANLEAILKSRGLDDAAIQQILQTKMQGAMRPTFGDQLMAGGAGMLSMGATQGKR